MFNPVRARLFVNAIFILYVIAQVHDCFSYPMREQAPALYNFARHCEEPKATRQSILTFVIPGLTGNLHSIRLKAMSCERKLYICGDIHGELNRLVWKATHELKIACADILVVGDFGAGFGRPNSMDVRYREVRALLATNDICLYTIRGNHDDPAFFDGTHDYERLHFLPDHHLIELCGKRIYPIGGAVSTDIDFIDPLTRKSRRMKNDTLIRFGSSKRIWWADEDPTQITEGLPETVDIIVSHEAPLSLEPEPQRVPHIRESTWQQVLETRRYLDYILKTVKPPLWFYGHYHNHYEGFVNDTAYQGLDICEIVRVER